MRCDASCCTPVWQSRWLSPTGACDHVQLELSVLRQWRAAWTARFVACGAHRRDLFPGRRAVNTLITVNPADGEVPFSKLTIKTRDRPGLLVEIVKVLKDISVNVVSAEVRGRLQPSIPGLCLKPSPALLVSFVSMTTRRREAPGSYYSSSRSHRFLVGLIGLMRLIARIAMLTSFAVRTLSMHTGLPRSTRRARRPSTRSW